MTNQPPKPTFEDALKREAGCYSNMLADMKLRNSDLMSMLGLTSEDHFRKGAKWGREYGRKEALASAEVLAMRDAIREFDFASQVHYPGEEYSRIWKERWEKSRMALTGSVEAFEKLSGGDAGG